MQVHESEQEVPQVFHALLDVVQERVCAFKRRQMHDLGTGNGAHGVMVELCKPN